MFVEMIKTHCKNSVSILEEPMLSLTSLKTLHLGLPCTLKRYKTTAQHRSPKHDVMANWVLSSLKACLKNTLSVKKESIGCSESSGCNLLENFNNKAKRLNVRSRLFEEAQKVSMVPEYWVSCHLPQCHHGWSCITSHPKIWQNHSRRLHCHV